MFQRRNNKSQVGRNAKSVLNSNKNTTIENTYRLGLASGFQ